MADTRRRLRSGTVVLGGMGLLAAALTACSSDPDKRCVDRDSYRLAKGYKVVSDKNCTSTKASVDGGWYYGGTRKSGYVSGGSFTRPHKSSGGGGHSGVHRGGFGGGHHSSGG
ncbi:hypothetical protein [Streptomyces broussonetiae]|uniref:Lipoprotein n=1 Tax=Streptomyces broussonetiae TaxID=2686304 RepID=A0A6I6NE91_9ACTN|nr:hypothetical protein [Streptomyces broussonetiae]QHA06407.1 hypothetical protein GQF42_26765 [Streptomyces broussonetiae]